jgi:hypothetical protein
MNDNLVSDSAAFAAAHDSPQAHLTIALVTLLVLGESLAEAKHPEADVLQSATQTIGSALRAMGIYLDRNTLTDLEAAVS